MSILKNPNHHKKIKHSAKILASALHQVRLAAKPGVSAGALDTIAETFIRDHGATPAFKGLYGFPDSIITEINEEVVHGLSSATKYIPDNSIVSFDCGVKYKGLYSDMCILMTFGELTPAEKLLVQKTEESLWAGIGAVRAGATVGDIGYAVNAVIEPAGLGNVTALGGHGLGYKPHTDPHITHKGRRGLGSQLVNNQVIAIEPMVTLGSGAVDFVKDPETGWEIIVSKERCKAAHIEHTILVTQDGHEVITDIPENEMLH